MTRDVLLLIVEHEATLHKWRQEYDRLSKEVESLVLDEREARMLWQTEFPTRRADGVGQPVTKLRKQIADCVSRQERLKADIDAKVLLVDGLRVEGDELERERLDRELAERILFTREREQAAWRLFCHAVKAAVECWPSYVDAVQDLDGLPEGAPSVFPVPRDLEAAVRLALRALQSSDGTDAYAGSPSVQARRFDLVNGRRNTDHNQTLFANTMSDMTLPPRGWSDDN